VPLGPRGASRGAQPESPPKTLVSAAFDPSRWDRERKYVPSRMQLYVTHQGEDDAERTVPLSADRPHGSMSNTKPNPGGTEARARLLRCLKTRRTALGVLALPREEAAPRGALPLPRVPERAAGLEGRRFPDLMPSRLGPQLLALQPSGYAVPGIPIVQVVIKGSAYEKEFRQRTGRAG
jgi:hypothetical protein